MCYLVIIIFLYNHKAGKNQTDTETTDKVICPISNFAHSLKGNEMNKELSKLANIPERTRDTDICETVVHELTSLNINLKKNFSVTMDGMPNMTGPVSDFADLFQGSCWTSDHRFFTALFTRKCFVQKLVLVIQKKCQKN